MNDTTSLVPGQKVIVHLRDGRRIGAVVVAERVNDDGETVVEVQRADSSCTTFVVRHRVEVA